MQRRTISRASDYQKYLSKLVTDYLDTGNSDIHRLDEHFMRPDAKFFVDLALGLSPNDIVNLCDKYDAFNNGICLSKDPEIQDIWRSLYHRDIEFSDERMVKEDLGYHLVPITDFYKEYRRALEPLKDMSKMDAIKYAIDNGYGHLLYHLLGKNPSRLESDMAFAWMGGSGGPSIDRNQYEYMNFREQHRNELNPLYFQYNYIDLDRILGSGSGIAKESVEWAQKNAPDVADILEDYYFGRV